MLSHFDKKNQKFLIGLKSLLLLASSAFVLSGISSFETITHAQVGESLVGQQKFVRDPHPFATIEAALDYGRREFDPKVHKEFYVNWDEKGYYVIDWELQEPVAEEPEEPETPENRTVHVVQAGEYLWLIAQKYGVSLDQLRAWNQLTTDELYVGQELVVGPQEQEPMPDIPDSSYYHHVKKGEYLWLIAQMHGVSVQDLRDWNELTTDELYVGQVLIVDPSVLYVPETKYRMHHVQEGETLYSIAKHYMNTVEEIRQLNGLTSNYLYVGQELIVTDYDA